MKAVKSTAVIKGLAGSTSSEERPERQRAMPAPDCWQFKRAVDRARTTRFLCRDARIQSIRLISRQNLSGREAELPAGGRAALRNSQVENG
jgi:hypothetical protein